MTNERSVHLKKPISRLSIFKVSEMQTTRSWMMEP